LNVFVECYCLGYGIFATKEFFRGDFLLDYHGELMAPSESDKLTDQDYVYYFSLNGEQYRCVFDISAT